MAQAQGTVPLRFVIVGGSIAGLATAYALQKVGHEVSLVEASDGKPSMLTAVLALPAATKILQQWGLSRLLGNISEGVDGVQYIDGESGQLLMTLSNVFLEEFKIDAVADFTSIPDKELRLTLYELAKQEGVIFRFNAKAVDVEPATGTVILEDGERLSADLIIGADGFYSSIRKYVVGDEDEKAEESIGTTKTALVSVSLSLQKILADETLLPLSDPSLWTLWLGDGFIGQGSVAQEDERIYSLRLELVYRGIVGPEDKHWREVGQAELGRFIDLESFEPRLRKLIKSGDQVYVKVFTNKRQTDSVVCPGSRCILVGEAAHSLISGNFLASTLDLEDAQILGRLFSRIQDRSQIGRFTTAYDEIRLPMSSSLFEFIQKRRASFMVPNGPLRDLRNSDLKRFAELREAGLTPGIFFALRSADDMVEDWWSKYGASLMSAPELRFSVLSNVEISVAKDIGSSLNW